MLETPGQTNQEVKPDSPLALAPSGAGKRQLGTNILSLYVLQGLNYLVPAAVLPFLVRVLGMERYGLLAFAQSFAQYFTLFTDYGFNFSATRAIAQQRNDPQALSRTFSSVLAIKFVLMVLGFLVLCAIVFAIPRFHRNLGFFLVAYIAVVGYALFPLWYFQGIENMKPISLIFGITRLAGALVLFGLVHHPKDALLALAIQSLTVFASGAIGLWIVLRSSHVSLICPRRRDIVHALYDGFHLFVSTAAISFYTNTNVFFVGLLAGNVQVGYFSAADKLVRAAQGLLGPVSQAVFPHISSLVIRSRDAAARFALATLRWMGSLALGLSLVLFLFARPISLLCFGKAGLATVPIIHLFAFLPVLIAASNVFGVQIMIPFGQDKTFSRILLAVGVLNLLVSPLLIHFQKAVGAGIALLGAELFVTIGTGLFALKTLRVPAVVKG